MLCPETTSLPHSFPSNPIDALSPSTSLTHHHIITSRHSHAYIHVVCTHKDPPNILIPLIDPCTSPAALRSTPIIPTVHPYIHPPIHLSSIRPFHTSTHASCTYQPSITANDDHHQNPSRIPLPPLASSSPFQAAGAGLADSPRLASVHHLTMQIQLKHLIYRSFSSLSLSLIARLKKRFVRFRLPKRPKSLSVSLLRKITRCPTSDV